MILALAKQARSYRLGGLRKGQAKELRVHLAGRRQTQTLQVGYATLQEDEAEFRFHLFHRCRIHLGQIRQQRLANKALSPTTHSSSNGTGGGFLSA